MAAATMLCLVLRRNLCLNARQYSKEVLTKKFQYKTIEPERYNEVIAHLQKFFYVDEPLSKSVQLSTSQGNPDLEAYIVETFEDKLSIMAVTEDDKLAGVMLNGYFRKGDKEKYDEKIAECKTESFRKIMSILRDIHIPVDFFTKFSVSEMFDARILSVDPEYRKHKLGWELLRRSHYLAIEHGLKVSKAEATGIFSQRVNEKLGYKTINEIIYEKYIDENGKRIFNVKPPHKSLKLMYKLFD